MKKRNIVIRLDKKFLQPEPTRKKRFYWTDLCRFSCLIHSCFDR